MVLSGPKLPELLDPGRYKDLFIAGGFDKGGGLVGYLAYSFDHGDTWTDISDLTNPPESPSLDVTFIREDPSGRVLVGLAKKDEQKLVIAEVLITAPFTLLTHGIQALPQKSDINVGSGHQYRPQTLPGSRRDQMFIAATPPRDRAPAERDVSVQQQHSAPLEP